MEEFDLMFGYTGNGCVVYDRMITEHGDYKKLAYVDEAGKITWYVPILSVPGLAILRIEHVANVHYQRYKDNH